MRVVIYEVEGADYIAPVRLVVEDAPSSLLALIERSAAEAEVTIRRVADAEWPDESEL